MKSAANRHEILRKSITVCLRFRVPSSKSNSKTKVLKSVILSVKIIYILISPILHFNLLNENLNEMYIYLHYGPLELKSDGTPLDLSFVIASLGEAI